MKSNHSHILLLWALFFLPFSSTYCPNSQDILKNHVPKSLQMQGSTTRSYCLDLADAPKDLDLLVSVLPRIHGDPAPKFTVVTRKKVGQKMMDVNYKSDLSSGNIVFISHKDLKDTSNDITINVISESRCDADLLVEWTKEIKMVVNEEKTIEGSEALSAIARLTIPKKDDIERIVIHVDALKTSLHGTPDLNVFINKGTSIPPFSERIESIPRSGAWFYGNSIVIDKESSLFCTDCVLTLSLKFVGSKSINIKTQTFQKITSIYGTTALDGVREGMKNIYSFQANKEEDQVLSIKVQKEFVRISIGCDKQPQPSKSDYLVDGSREIILAQRECPSGNYFVLVYSSSFSIYSLRAMGRKSNKLELGKAPVIGEIFPKEKITYEVLIPLSAPEEVLFSLDSQKSPDLSITLCRFPTDCPGLIPADGQHQITNYYGFDNFSIEKFNYDDKMKLRINPRKSGCYPILVQDQTSLQAPLPVCAYLVTLSNKQSSSVGFTLTSDSKRPNLLRISDRQDDIHLAKNERIYYVFSLPYQDIDSVQVQFTKFFGDFDIIISKENKNPDYQENSPDFQFSPEGLITVKNPSETYYIGIRAVRTSSFSLSAVIPRPRWLIWSMNEEWAIPLSPGKPQKGVLLARNHTDMQIYKLLLTQDDDWEGTLCIKLNSLSGPLHMSVNNNGDVPTSSHEMWRAKGSELEISSSDPKFKKRGIYYIGVNVRDDDPPANHTYHITYSLKEKSAVANPVHTFLSPNTPSYGVVKKGEFTYFESLLLDDESPMTIYKSENIELYISTDSENKYPSQNSYTYTTKGQNQNKNSITLPSSAIVPIYITAISIEESSSPYSLSMRSDSSVIALGDGQQIQSLIPRNNHPALFYYYAVPSQNSVISVKCPGKEFVIYAKRIKVDVQSFDEPWRKPLDENTAEFTGTTEISIPPFSTSDLTIVAISVYFKETQEVEEGSQLFTILASSQINQLPIGTPPFWGTIAQDQYVYFRVDVTKPQSTLLISLESYPGNSALFVSYGDDKRPTASNHQFASISHSKSHIIQIDNTDISPEESMSGSWVIGVYGYTASLLTLRVVYEERKIIDLKAGTPVEMSLEESSFVYFMFFHGFESHLQINLTQFSGQMNLYVNPVTEDQELLNHLPNKEYSHWQIARTGAITIPLQDNCACVSCLYIMKVETGSEKSKFSLVVNQLGDILLENLFQYSGKIEPRKSAIYMLPKDAQETQLNIEVSEEKLTVLGSNNTSINLENYLWKETVGSNKKILLTKSADFLLLYNPTERNLDFSFSITPRFITLDRIEQLYNLDPYEKKVFLYKFPEESDGETPVDLDILLYADAEKLVQIDWGQQQIQAQPWPANSIEGPFFFQSKSSRYAKINESHCVYQQKFSGNMTKKGGKYLVEIASLWDFPVKFCVAIGISGLPEISLSKNEQYYENNFAAKTELYDYMTTSVPRIWYLGVYSCDATVDLIVECGNVETGMVTIPGGGSYLYKNWVTFDTLCSGGRSKFVVRANQNSLEEKGKVTVFSSWIEEQEFRDYDIKEDDLEINVTYKYQENSQSRVTVEFKPVEFKGPESNDSVLYQVRLCSERSQQFKKEQFCWHDEECVDSEVLLSVNKRAGLAVDFQEIKEGNHSVKIKATVIHRGQWIKSIQPYAMSYVDVKKKELEVITEENKPTFWRFVVGVMAFAMVMAAALIEYKKVKKTTGNGVGSPETVESSVKGFEAFEDEEISPGE